MRGRIGTVGTHMKGLYHGIVLGADHRDAGKADLILYMSTSSALLPVLLIS